MIIFKEKQFNNSLWISRAFIYIHISIYTEFIHFFVFCLPRSFTCTLHLQGKLVHNRWEPYQIRRKCECEKRFALSCGLLWHGFLAPLGNTICDLWSGGSYQPELSNSDSRKRFFTLLDFSPSVETTRPLVERRGLLKLSKHQQTTS